MYNDAANTMSLLIVKALSSNLAARSPSPTTYTYHSRCSLMEINEALLFWQGAFNIYAKLLAAANQHMYAQYRAHNDIPIIIAWYSCTLCLEEKTTQQFRDLSLVEDAPWQQDASSSSIHQAAAFPAQHTPQTCLSFCKCLQKRRPARSTKGASVLHQHGCP